MNNRALVTTVRLHGTNHDVILNCANETFSQPNTWLEKLNIEKEIRQRLGSQRKTATTIHYLLLMKHESDNTISAWGARRQGYCLAAFVEKLNIDLSFEGSASLLIPFDDKLYCAQIAKRGSSTRVINESTITANSGMDGIQQSNTVIVLNDKEGPSWFMLNLIECKTHVLDIRSDTALSHDHYLAPPQKSVC